MRPGRRRKVGKEDGGYEPEPCYLRSCRIYRETMVTKQMNRLLYYLFYYVSVETFVVLRGYAVNIT